MKKHLALLLAGVLVVGVCGCSKTTQTTEVSPLATSETEQVAEETTANAENATTDEKVEASQGETRIFTDSCGREGEIPVNLTQVAPSGSVAQMIIYAVAPDKLTCLAGKLGDEQKAYIPEKYQSLPVTGQFYGKGDLNKEALIEAAPQVIIDLGDKKEGMAEDLDHIQEQTGIPTIFIEATVDTYPEMFRTLGELLDEKEQGEALAAYAEATYKEAQEAKAKIKEEDKLRVMFGTGETGLDCNAKGSIHCGVLEAVGVENAIEVAEVSSKGGGNTITMEEVIKANPDVILLASGGPYATLSEDPYWSGLDAVKEGKYYEIPYGPYHFLASPPSINQIIGIKWLGNLLYPELYPYNMEEELQKFYKLFWHCDLSVENAKALLAHSTYKDKE